MASGSAATSLSGASAVSSGAAVDFTAARRNICMVVIPTGTITGGLVALEGSQDNTNWVYLTSLTPTTGQNSFQSVNEGAFRYGRASILAAITGGGSVTVTIMESDSGMTGLP